MMVDNNCKYGINSTRVTVSVLYKMDPTMAKQLIIYELYDKSYSSGDDSFHIVGSSDYDMGIINSYTDIRIQ